MSEKTKLLKDALTPELLKQVVSNSLLKEIMTDAVVYRTVPKSFAGCLQTGIYQILPEVGVTDYPGDCYKYGVLLVFRADHFASQLYFPDSKPLIYVRTWYDSLGWRPWYQIQMQSVT